MQGESAIEARLLDEATQFQSPKEISKKLNGAVKPKSVVDTVTELLDKRDWLTEAQQDRLLMRDLQKLKNDLQAKVQDDDQAAYGPLVRVLEQIGKRIDKLKEQSDDRMLQIQEAHARVMFQAIEVAFHTSVLKLQERYPEFDRIELQEILEESLPLALKSLDDKIAE